MCSFSAPGPKITNDAIRLVASLTASSASASQPLGQSFCETLFWFSVGCSRVPMDCSRITCQNNKCIVTDRSTTLSSLKQLQEDEIIVSIKSGLVLLFSQERIFRKVLHLWWHGKNKISRNRWNKKFGAELKKNSCEVKIQTMVRERDKQALRSTKRRTTNPKWTNLRYKLTQLCTLCSSAYQPTIFSLFNVVLINLCFLLTNASRFNRRLLKYY